MSVAPKRIFGQYYTHGNPFSVPAFREWAATAGLPRQTILEPFAGANSIITHLQALNLCEKFAAFDINPQAPQVQRRDTLKKFPRHYNVCVTNPPWLAKNFVTHENVPGYQLHYDNLYKDCLAAMLSHCGYVAALVPASYSRSRLFFKRLHAFVLLHAADMFLDTAHPVGLALFGPAETSDFTIYYDDQKIGTYLSLRRHLPAQGPGPEIKFNIPSGNLGLIAFDNTRTRSIRFCAPDEITHYAIKPSSRFITKLQVNFPVNSRRLTQLNSALENFRDQTQDFFLTPFKGLRRDGRYRRRMDFALAKTFVAQQCPSVMD